MTKQSLCWSHKWSRKPSTLSALTKVTTSVCCFYAWVAMHPPVLCLWSFLQNTCLWSMQNGQGSKRKKQSFTSSKTSLCWTPPIPSLAPAPSIRTGIPWSADKEWIASWFDEVYAIHRYLSHGCHGQRQYCNVVLGNSSIKWRITGTAVFRIPL